MAGLFFRRIKKKMGFGICRGYFRKAKMNQVLRNALVMKYKGEIAEAEANISVYLNNPVGIGEHSDIVAALNEQVEKAVHAQEKLDYVMDMKW